MGHVRAKMGHFFRPKVRNYRSFYDFSASFARYGGPDGHVRAGFARPRPFFARTSKAVAPRGRRRPVCSGRIVGCRGRGSPGPQRRGRGAEDVPGTVSPGHSRAGWGTREYWRGGGPESKRAGLRGAPTSCQRGSATAEPSYPACAQARSHPGLDRAVIGTRGDPCPAPVPVWAARPRRPAAHPEVPLWRGRGPRVP